MPTRYAPYYRVSHKDVERGISIDVQQSHVAPYVAARRGTLTDAYIDDGKSAFSEDLTRRPAFQRLLADARQRRFDVVVVYLFDRFGRRMRVALQAIHELQLCGVRVESATEPNDWLSQGINLLMAEQYSRLLSRRMKDVRSWEAAQGRHVGPVPVGYDRVDGVLVPNADLAAIALLGELYRTGQHSYATAADALNAAGYRIPNPQTGERKLWGKYAVEEVLKNPVYRGKVVCAGQEYTGQHAALWSDDDWHAIQAAMQRRSTYRHTPEARARGDGGLLSTLAKCAACGANLWHQGRGAADRRCYRCGGRDARTCTAPMSHADAVEQQVRGLFAHLHLPDDWHARALQHITRQARTATPAIDRTAIEQRLKRLARLYEDGLKSDAEYVAERDRLQAQLHDAAPAPVGMVQIERAATLLRDIPTLLAQASMLQQRAVLAHLFSAIWIERHTVVALTPKRDVFPIMYIIWAGWASSPHPVPDERPALWRDFQQAA